MQVRQLATYIRERSRQRSDSSMKFETASITAVTSVGMGDRVCVDLCSMMAPGEGLLAGSFARALFLVHSEVREEEEGCCHDACLLHRHRSVGAHGRIAKEPGILLA